MHTVCPSAIQAQSTRVVPAYAASIEGNIEAQFTLLLGGNSRYQQLYVSSAIAASSATLTSLAWRRDAQASDPLPRWGFQNVKVTLSQTKQTPATMSVNLASNVRGPVSVVYDTAWSLPALGRARRSPVANFDIRVPFRRPYVLQVARGNLLVDIAFGRALGTGGGGFSSTPPYGVDGVSWGANGSSMLYASRGTQGATRGVFAGVNGGRRNSELKPGGTYTFSVLGPAPSIALAWLGFSNTSALGGQLALPFDLTPLGAPGNRLVASPDLVLPAQATRARLVGLQLFFGADYAIRVPRTPSLAGRSLYHQGCIAVPGANALGLVFTGGVAVGFGPSFGPPLTQGLLRFSAFPFGIPIVDRIAIANRPLTIGGPVTRFDGSFR